MLRSQLPARAGTHVMPSSFADHGRSRFATVTDRRPALAAVAALLLSYGWEAAAEPWFASLLLVGAVGNFSFGYWELTIARSASARA